jgi:hypothetical protein
MGSPEGSISSVSPLLTARDLIDATCDRDWITEKEPQSYALAFDVCDVGRSHAVQHERAADIAGSSERRPASATSLANLAPIQRTPISLRSPPPSREPWHPPGARSPQPGKVHTRFMRQQGRGSRAKAGAQYGVPPSPEELKLWGQLSPVDKATLSGRTGHQVSPAESPRLLAATAHAMPGPLHMMASFHASLLIGKRARRVLRTWQQISAHGQLRGEVHRSHMRAQRTRRVLRRWLAVAAADAQRTEALRSLAAGHLRARRSWQAFVQWCWAVRLSALRRCSDTFRCKHLLSSGFRVRCSPILSVVLGATQ